MVFLTSRKEQLYRNYKNVMVGLNKLSIPCTQRVDNVIIPTTNQLHNYEIVAHNTPNVPVLYALTPAASCESARESLLSAVPWLPFQRCHP
jgi:hypothetical protein